MERIIELQIEIEIDSTPFMALDKAITNIVKAYNASDKITARTAVLFIMEATSLIPGVFNIDMLRERQLLQDFLHGAQHFKNFKLQTLEYTITLAPEIYRTPSVRKACNKKDKACQTDIMDPSQGQLLSFNNAEYSLEWVLKSKN